MKTILKSNICLAASALFLLGTTACSGPETSAETESQDNMATESMTEEVAEEPVADFEEENKTSFDRIVVYEDGMTHQPALEEGDERTTEERNEDSEYMRLYNERFLPQAGDVDGFMNTCAFQPTDVEMTVAAIPMEESQKIAAYNKKGKFEGEVQVVSKSASGEIDHIVFTGKHHVDQYNVSAGLTGKEARKLRKELKHMAHKGQVFLYQEESNVMYVMDAKDNVSGDEVTMEEVDSMTITAVVWKDAKHHKADDHEGHNH